MSEISPIEILRTRIKEIALDFRRTARESEVASRAEEYNAFAERLEDVLFFERSAIDRGEENYQGTHGVLSLYVHDILDDTDSLRRDGRLSESEQSFNAIFYRDIAAALVDYARHGGDVSVLISRRAWRAKENTGDKESLSTQ